MIGLGREIVDRCLKLGAEEADAFIAKGRSISVESRRRQIEISEEREILGVGVRVIIEGGLGFASSHNPHRAEEVCRAAVDAARVRGGGDWPGLPEPAKYSSVEGVYDKRVEEVTLEMAVEDMVTLLDSAGSIKGVEPTSGHVAFSHLGFTVVNSRGVEVSDHGTMVYGYMDCIARENDSISTGQDFRISRSLDVDFESLGNQVAELTRSSLGGVKIEPRETAVLLRPIALSGILENTFIPSINAENVQKGRSSLSNRLEEQIASEQLSIFDDGLRPAGMNTAISDDEGVPQRKTPVIEDGVLKGFLYDCERAGREGRESTGNASRETYSSTPTVNVTNLTIDHPTSDLVAETRDGVVVSSVIGAHTANPVSGDFSVEARNAFMVKEGEIQSPIRSLMISGNVFDLMRDLDGADSDVRDVSGIVAPTIRVAKMRIVG